MSKRTGGGFNVNDMVANMQDGQKIPAFDLEFKGTEYLAAKKKYYKNMPTKAPVFKMAGNGDNSYAESISFGMEKGLALASKKVTPPAVRKKKLEEKSEIEIFHDLTTSTA